MALTWSGGCVFRIPALFAVLLLTVSTAPRLGVIDAHADTSAGERLVTEAASADQGRAETVLSREAQREAELRLKSLARDAGRGEESPADSSWLAFAGTLPVSEAAVAQPVGAEADQEKIKQLVSAGDAAVKAQDYRRAVELYDEALALDPSSRTVQRKLESALKRVEQADAAARQAEERLAQEALRQEGLAREAEAESLYREGRSAYDDGQYAAAIEKLNAALAINSGHRNASRYLERAQGRLADAQSNAVKAEADAYYAQGREYLSSGQHDEAIAAFERALEVDPSHSGAARYRDRALKDKSDYVAATQKAAEQAAQREAELLVKQKVAEGDALAKAGDYEGSLAAYQEALVADPGNRSAARGSENARKQIAQALEAEMQTAETVVETIVETLEIPDPAVSEAPTSWPEEAVAVPVDESPEWNEAEAVSETAEAMADTAAAQADPVRRGDIYLAAGLLDEAESSYRAALEQNPGNSAATRGLNQVADLKSKQETQAATEAAAARGAAEAALAEQARRHFERGKYLDEQGDVIAAMEAWQKAIEVQPEFPEARAFIEQKQGAYQAAMEAKEVAEKHAAQEAIYEENLDKVYTQLLEFVDADIDDLLQNLGTFSDFDITVAADVDGSVTALLRNKTLREILDALLIPNGWRWERVGNNIFVTTNFQTKIFTLPPDEYMKLEDILLDPQKLKNPAQSLQAILWGDEGPKVEGTDIRLNPKTRQLIITDSESNIERVREFLSNLPELAEAYEPMRVEIYPLDPEIAQKLYNIVNEALKTNITTVREGRQLLLDQTTNTLIVRDTQENINLVEQILTDKSILDGIRSGDLEARRFVVTTDNLEDKGDSARFRRREIVQYTMDILGHMLYSQEGREEAVIRGRRIFEGRVPEMLEDPEDWDFDGTITVVDTPDNLKRVETYLSTVSGQRQVTRFMRVTHADVNRLKNLLDRVTGRVRETDVAGGTYEEDYQGAADPTGRFGRRLNLQVRLTADEISSSIIGIAPDVTILDEIESLIRELDIPEQQVEIEARLVEVSQQDIENFDVDLSIRGIGRSSLDPFNFNTNPLDVEFLSQSVPTGGTALSFGIIGETQLDLLVNFIRRSSTSEILSAPKVTTISAPTVETYVDVSTEQPYIESAEFDTKGDDDPTNNTLITTFSTTNVGIRLNVTPTVLPDGYVIMHVNPVVSVLSGRLPVFVGGDAFEGIVPSLGDLGQPIIDVREANVQVRVKDGDTLAIGGLIRDEVFISESRVPFLSDLPIIGALFREESYSRTKNSLLILVTVRIIPSD